MFLVKYTEDGITIDSSLDVEDRKRFLKGAEI